MRSFCAPAAIAGVLLALAAPAGAQAPYVDAACGQWTGDVWVSYATCGPDARRHEEIAATIAAVKGRLLTIVAPANRRLTIDATPAVANRTAGALVRGRRILARGYWDAGRFFATIILTRRAAGR
ncbi:MAG TPA: hypothetical protein VIG46_07975 [Candidatus Baltobacteraceae bacterium]|jgi:hypothetical protein